MSYLGVPLRRNQFKIKAFGNSTINSPFPVLSLRAPVAHVDASFGVGVFFTSTVIRQAHRGCYWLWP
jgi:hypothetical protein